MKKYQGNIWTEELAGGTINVGFTREFIAEVLGECFHITQSNLYLLAAGKPMLTIETNEGLKVIRSPITGTVLKFSEAARDYPDRITEEDVIVSILPKGVTVPVATKSAAKKSAPVNDWIIQDDVAVDLNQRWIQIPINNRGR